MKQSYTLVDENGFPIDVVLLDPQTDEISRFHVAETYEGLFTPQWNFDAEEWSEGLSEGEVEERLKEIEEQGKAPTLEHLVEENKQLREQQAMLEGALVELVQILL